MNSDVAPGAKIDEYEVVEELGAGDFAVVYCVSLDSEVFALKYARSTPQARDRLQNEASVLQTLDHAGVPQVVDRRDEGDAPYFVMTFATGETLQAHLNERAALNTLFGDIEALAVVESLLEVLVHLGERGDLVHRDIKSANVVVRRTDLRASLIDFGFAKTHGVDEIRTGDSFFRVGAARYCPPVKLDHPGRADRSHDVFAVGVLGYEMLTGRHPWSAAMTGDRDELLRAYRHQAAPIRDVQPLVREEVARFIESLLEVRDEFRPTANKALETASRLRSQLQPRLPGNYSQSRPIAFPRVLRDPIHGDVRLTEYEWEVLDTRELQRLRWIRQLGFANLVYPGAEHSRLSHSIGTLHRVEQLLRSIEESEGTRFSVETRIVARLYALVHDVPHVAHGHSLEDELGIFTRHDKNASRIDRLVLSPGSALGAVLQKNEMGRNVRSMFDASSTISLEAGVSDLVSGATGADVLDYIDRDAFHCGLDHRVDSAIFRQLRLHQPDGDSDRRVVSLLFSRHGARIDREYAVESLFRERFAMFMKVYSHPRKLAATAVLDKAMSERGDRRPPVGEEELESMPDDVLIERLRTSRRAVVARCGEMLRNRVLPTPVYRASLLPDTASPPAYEEAKIDLERRNLLTPNGRRQVEAELARAAGASVDDVFMYLPIRPPGYKRIEHWVSEAEGSEGRRDATHEPIAQVRRNHLRLWEVWVYYARPGDIDDDHTVARLASEATSLFGRNNRLDIPLREDRLF